MTLNYAYTPYLWPSAMMVLFLLALAVYSWRRRSVAGALPFAISALLAVLLVAGEAMMHLAGNEETRIFWNKFADVWWLPSTTAVTCFILEYAWPGRWLTRRNLVLLSIVPLLGTLNILTGDFFHLIPPSIKIGGIMGESFGQFGGFLFIYSLLLALINFFVFTWLFVRSPPHRWPVFLMAIGQIVTRVLLVRSSPELDARLLYVPELIFAYLGYAIALFSFHIFDPVPMARQTAIDQLHSGMLVLDHQGRVVSLNPSAERILQISTNRARGKPVKDVLPAYPEALPANPDETEIEFSLVAGKKQRFYMMTNSLLNDFRGLEVGRMVLLRDITEQKQAQEQIMEQQRTLATQNERERMARELHDSLGQVLSFTGFQVESAAKLYRDGQADEAAAQLGRLGTVVRDAHADLREHILNLSSTPSVQKPFFTTVDQYLDGFTTSYDLQTHLSVAPGMDDRSFSPDARLQVFRILQEALSNARKHGQAHQVRVAFSTTDGQINMSVQDDGCGFAPDQVIQDGKSHYGLQFMQERASQIGGSLRVHSVPGSGTQIKLEFPIKEF